MVRKLNCSLKKNKNNSLCKRKIKSGEAIFSVIMPKRDNSGQKINNKLYQKYISKINNRFGGSTTMPSVLGCFVNEQSGRTECEANIRIDAVRDFENPFDDRSNLSISERKELLKEDFKFMKKIAKHSGDEFGQTAMLVIKDDIDDASLILTKRKDSLPREKIFDDFFDREV